MTEDHPTENEIWALEKLQELDAAYQKEKDHLVTAGEVDGAAALGRMVGIEASSDMEMRRLILQVRSKIDGVPSSEERLEMLKEWLLRLEKVLEGLDGVSDSETLVDAQLSESLFEEIIDLFEGVAGDTVESLKGKVQKGIERSRRQIEDLTEILAEEAEEDTE